MIHNQYNIFHTGCIWQFPESGFGSLQCKFWQRSGHAWPSGSQGTQARVHSRAFRELCLPGRHTGETGEWGMGRAMRASSPSLASRRTGVTTIIFLFTSLPIKTHWRKISIFRITKLCQLRLGSAAYNSSPNTWLNNRQGYFLHMKEALKRAAQSNSGSSTIIRHFSFFSIRLSTWLTSSGSLHVPRWLLECQPSSLPSEREKGGRGRWGRILKDF